MEAFSDPIFENAAVKASDIRNSWPPSPAVGRAVLDLYQGYRRHLPLDAGAERRRRRDRSGSGHHSIRGGD